MRDGAFLVRLSLREDGEFQLQDFDYLEPADTSLWRVSGGGRELLLGGVLHALTRSSYPLPMGYEQAYLNSEVLVLDIDNVGEVFAPDVDAYLRAASAANEPPLRERLDGGVYRNLELHLEDLGLPLRLVEDWRLPFVADLLYNLALEEMGYRWPGVAHWYGRRALLEDRPIMLLQTLAQRRDLLLEAYAEANPDALVGGGLEAIHGGAIRCAAGGTKPRMAAAPGSHARHPGSGAGAGRRRAPDRRGGAAAAAGGAGLQRGVLLITCPAFYPSGRKPSKNGRIRAPCWKPTGLVPEPSTLPPFRKRRPA